MHALQPVTILTACKYLVYHIPYSNWLTLSAFYIFLLRIVAQSISACSKIKSLPLYVENVDRYHGSLVDAAAVSHHLHAQNAK